MSASHLSAFFCPMLQTRSASNRPVSSKEKAARDKAKKKKKKHSMFKQYDLKDAEQFSLCDAMRFELLSLHDAAARSELTRA